MDGCPRLRILLRVLVGQLILVASMTAAQAPPRRPTGRMIPQTQTRSDVIAFCSDRDGDFEIYLINVDGSNFRQLTDNTANDWAPAWSPDATQIAFESDRDGDYEIYVMDADGSEPQRLTHNPAGELGPAWSPDGDRIAFSSDRNGLRDIYIMNSDGSGLGRITNNGYGNDGPDWSKDGSRLLFRSVRNDLWQIFVMNADGSDQRYVTDGTSPDWSGDGARIVFESNRDGPFEIYAMEADGANVERLTFAGTFSHQPDWSPDGTRIAYWSSQSGNGDIWVMNSDGSDPMRVTFDDGADAAPAWRPIAPPAQLWARTFGGPFFDTTKVVKQSRDGGFIVGGATVSFSGGSSNLWLIKLDESGNQVWDQIYGGASDDDVLSIQEIDDGYIIAGLTESYGGGGEDFWLIRTTETGAEMWSRTYGGPDHDRAQSVQQTPDGGFVISGGTMSFESGLQDVWLVRTDGNGHEIWSRTYGGSWDDKAYTVLLADDGGYVLCGYRGVADGNFDVWLVKVDQFGDIIWDRTFGGPGWDNSYSCLRARDGGFFLAGYNFSADNSDQDAWIIKTDERGDLQWERVFRGPGTDNIYSARETRDGGFVLAGLSNAHGDGDFDVWLGRTDAGGNILWTRTLGGAEDDFGFSVDRTADGGFIVAGRTNSFGQGEDDGWVVRLGPVGQGTDVAAALRKGGFGGNQE